MKLSIFGDKLLKGIKFIGSLTKTQTNKFIKQIISFKSNATINRCEYLY